MGLITDRWMIAELFANIVVLIAVFIFLDVTVLKYYFIAMFIGQCMTAFLLFGQYITIQKIMFIWLGQSVINLNVS